MLLQCLFQSALFEVVISKVIDAIGDIGVIGAETLSEHSKPNGVMMLRSANSPSLIGKVPKLNLEVADLWGLCGQLG